VSANKNTIDAKLKRAIAADDSEVECVCPACGYQAWVPASLLVRMGLPICPTDRRALRVRELH
jgi:hypothetical protein